MSVLWEQFIESRAEADYRKDLARAFRRLDSLAGLMASDVTAEQIESALADFRRPIATLRCGICVQRSISESRSG